jgi:hypothetical protein
MGNDDREAKNKTAIRIIFLNKKVCMRPQGFRDKIK